MKTAVTWDLTKTHETVDSSPRDHHPRQRSGRCPGWADFTTAMNGRKPEGDFRRARPLAGVLDHCGLDRLNESFV